LSSVRVRRGGGLSARRTGAEKNFPFPILILPIRREGTWLVKREGEKTLWSVRKRRSEEAVERVGELEGEARRTILGQFAWEVKVPRRGEGSTEIAASYLLR